MIHVSQFKKEQELIKILFQNGMRVTTARKYIAKCLFSNKHRHVCATDIAKEVSELGVNLALATVYNVLKDFSRIGLLNALDTDTAIRWFDTKLEKHHHAIDEETCKVIDVPYIKLEMKPKLPNGYTITDYSITFKIRKNS